MENLLGFFFPAGKIPGETKLASPERCLQPNKDESFDTSSRADFFSPLMGAGRCETSGLGHARGGS